LQDGGGKNKCEEGGEENLRLERLGMQLGEREIIEQSCHLRAHKGPVRALEMSRMGAPWDKKEGGK
jgi:CO dehydrogenase/acetyl-CoA synthase alpha subunit